MGRSPRSSRPCTEAFGRRTSWTSGGRTPRHFPGFGPGPSGLLPLVRPRDGPKARVGSRDGYMTLGLADCFPTSPLIQDVRVQPGGVRRDDEVSPLLGGAPSRSRTCGGSDVPDLQSGPFASRAIDAWSPGAVTWPVSLSPAVTQGRRVRCQGRHGPGVLLVSRRTEGSLRWLAATRRARGCRSRLVLDSVVRVVLLSTVELAPISAPYGAWIGREKFPHGPVTVSPVPLWTDLLSQPGSGARGTFRDSQGRRDSNSQPPVLETGALPVAPHPYAVLLFNFGDAGDVRDKRKGRPCEVVLDWSGPGDPVLGAPTSRAAPRGCSASTGGCRTAPRFLRSTHREGMTRGPGQQPAARSPRGALLRSDCNSRALSVPCVRRTGWPRCLDRRVETPTDNP